MRVHHPLRAVLYIFGGLLAVCVLVIYFFNWNSLRPYIARKSKEMTGRELRIAGDLRPRWRWPPGLSANQVSFENAPWAKRDQLFQASHVEVSLSPLPLLLRRQLIFPYIEIDGGVVALEHQPGLGSWSLTKPGEKEKAKKPSEPKEEGPAMIFRQIALQNTRIIYTDKKSPLFVDVLVHKGNLAGSGAVWRTYGTDLSMGHSELQGEYTLDLQDRLKMTGKLHAPRLHVDDFLALMGKHAETPEAKAKAKVLAGQKPKGPLFSDDPLGLEWLKNFDQELDLTVHELTSSTSPQPLLRDGAVELSLRGGLLTVPKLALTKGGVFKASGKLDARAHPYAMDMNLAFSRIDLGKFVDEAVEDYKDKKADAGEKVAKPIVKQADRVADNTYGLLGGEVKVTSHGNSQAQLVKHLRGQAGMAMENGHISDVLTYITALDVGKAIGRYLGGDKGSDVQCLIVTTTIKDGVASTDTALMSTKEANIRAKGHIDLGGEKVDLQVKTYPKKISIDSLRAPINIKGPFQDLKVQLESGTLIAKAVAAVALGVVLTPPAAILPFVEAGLGDKGACAQHIAELTALRQEPKKSH